MADIMRATTPINNRNIITPTKEHRDASALPFDFQDLSKIKTTNAQSEMLGQNNVLRENGSSATALFSMLRDPEVATSFLKNIFFLREIVGLMPLNNETQTEEIQQLLNRLILSPEEIAQEMINQENIATIFKGDLFETLRKLLSANGKTVSENISQKFSQVPLAQVNDLGEAVKQSVQTTQSTAENQTAQTTQNAEGQNQSANQISQGNNTQTTQHMIEGFIPPKQETISSDNPDNLFSQDVNSDGDVNTQQTEGNVQPNNQTVTNESRQMLEQQNIAEGQQNVTEHPTQYVVYENGELVVKNNTDNTPSQLNQNTTTMQENSAKNNISNMPTNKEVVNDFFKTANEIKSEIPRLIENTEKDNATADVNFKQVDSQKNLEDSVINLLKAINSQQNRTDVLDAVKNNLLYLKESFTETSEYSSSLDELSKTLESLMNGTITKNEFPQIKSQVLNLLDSLQNSVLYDEEMAKTVGLAKYNLSRYNSNDNLIVEAFSKLLQNVPDKQLKDKLTNELVKYLENEPLREASYESKTMSALTQILEKQSGNVEAKMLNADSIDKIVHGLLSSPSNFTPLLHYVIPVDNGQTQAMAEIWINPNGEEDVEGGVSSGKKMTHMLVVFEIDGIGKFETELYAEDKNITLSVMCPPEYVKNYKGVNADIRRACEATGYRFKSIEITELRESRSLIDVFRSLPARRSGINVTI